MASKRGVRRRAERQQTNPDPTHEESSCLDKELYLEKYTALSELDRLLNEKDADPRTLRVYRCQYCTNWHVGNIRVNSLVGIAIY